MAKVTALTRRAPNLTHDKLDVILHSDFSSYPPELLEKLRGHDGVIWDLGTSSNGISKEEYTKITQEYALAAAKAFSTLGTPGRPFTFAHLSGAGATWKASSGPLFARVKGRTEKQLVQLESPSFKVYNFRAGGIAPTVDVKTSGRQLELYKRVLCACAAEASLTLSVPIVGTLYPPLMIPGATVGRAMLKSIVEGLPGKGGPDESGVLENREIKAFGAEGRSEL